jgi:hypothetical protein
VTARVAALVVAVAAAAVSAAVATAAQSPQALRGSIFAAARAQSSVHYVTATTGNGNVIIVADAGRTRGIQRVRYASAGKSGHATIIAANRTAYVLGDEFTLHGFLGLAKTQAARYANVWIRVPHQSHLYAAIADAVTLPSFLAEIYPRTNLVRQTRTAKGLPLVGVQGSTRHQRMPFVEAVFARTGGKPLPVVEVEATTSASFRSTTAMGRWSEKLHISIPRHAVPIVSSAGTTA